MLNGICSRVLVNAATPALIGSPEPYVPETPDDVRAAHWLALPVVGLLAADLAGYTACYRPTTLGRAVVQAMLADAVLQRQYASHANYANYASACAGAERWVATAPTVWMRQTAPVAYASAPAQPRQQGAHHGR
jgi:hypothetical protein